MSLIGIYTQSVNEPYLKQQLTDILPENQIFFLKENSIQNLTNIKFSIILIGKKMIKNNTNFKAIIEKSDYLIFNTDIKENIELLENLTLNLITYGFNSKATITTSSVEEQKMLICLQRGIKNLQGKIIEPQEIEIETSQEISSYALMEFISLKLLFN
jgi:hypothetical protein